MQSNIIDRIDPIRDYLQEGGVKPLQEGSRWVDVTRVCRRDTFEGARAPS